MGLKLSNQQYNSIMNSYSRLQDDSRERLDYNKEKAYGKIPALVDLDNEFLEAISSLKSQNLYKKIDEINAKRKALLTSAGFPEDFLTPKFQCDICKDTGFVDNEPCKCYQARVINLLYGSGKWQNLFGAENFSTFNLSFFDEGASKKSAELAFTRAKDYVENILNPKEGIQKNLMISGKTGTGKTFLCNCIAKELIENNIFVVYFTAPSLFELFEKNTFRRTSGEEEFSSELNEFSISYSNLFDCDLLIIDDLGTEVQNTFTNAKFFNVINQRLVNRLPILISTNLDMRDLNLRYSERLSSRISGEFSLIQLKGTDIRSKKRIISAQNKNGGDHA